MMNPVPSAQPGAGPGSASQELERFPTQAPAGTLYQRLRLFGLTEAQAGNLTARASGLRQTRRPWRIDEVQRLLFLRSLVEGGRISS
jgi:hypothetical protein